MADGRCSNYSHIIDSSSPDDILYNIMMVMKSSISDMSSETSAEVAKMMELGIMVVCHVTCAFGRDGRVAALQRRRQYEDYSSSADDLMTAINTIYVLID